MKRLAVAEPSTRKKYDSVLPIEFVDEFEDDLLRRAIPKQIEDEDKRLGRE